MKYIIYYNGHAGHLINNIFRYETHREKWSLLDLFTRKLYIICHSEKEVLEYIEGANK